MRLRVGQRVMYQPWVNGRPARVDRADRGTYFKDEVIWDHGRNGEGSDLVEPSGWCPDHGFMALPLARGIPDVANTPEHPRTGDVG